MKELRCSYCGKLLAEHFAGEIVIKCSRCKKYTVIKLTNNEKRASVI